MRIHNIRMWGATNSSSTHTVIRLGENSTPTERPANMREYGWGNFVLTSDQEKMNYIVATTVENLQPLFPVSVVDDIIYSLFGVRLSIVDNRIQSCYVDHQSLICIPLMRNRKEINRQFLSELKDFIMSDGIAIFGGSDNSSPRGDEIAARYGEEALSLPIRDPRHVLIAQKDPVYNYWVLYNQTTGGRMRFSFDDSVDASRSSIPELVDVKITDFCNHGCSFCYQSSTSRGTHAKNLMGLSWKLEDMGVLEVAIGGGEPTTHPGLWSFMAYLHDHGISPSFTTRSFDWMYNRVKREAYELYANRCAISVTTDNDTTEAIRIINESGIKRAGITFQYVLGTSSVYALANIARMCIENEIKLLILGYKTNGFGANFTPLRHDNWISVLGDMIKREKLRGYWIGVDTACAAQFREELLGQEQSNRLFLKFQEGTHSMYIDAVAGTMAPSSYCDPDKVVTMPATSEESLRVYRNFQ